MEDLLFALKAFIFSEIFHRASSNLDDFQIENTQSSSLCDALDKISIENGAHSFSEEIFSQLEAEKDEITPIELMVFCSFQFFHYQIISSPCSRTILRRFISLFMILLPNSKVRLSNPPANLAGISVPQTSGTVPALLCYITP